MGNYKHRGITEKIIGAAYKVHNTLGSGFLEKVYQNSLAIEFRMIGFEKYTKVKLTNHKILFYGVSEHGRDKSSL